MGQINFKYNKLKKRTININTNKFYKSTGIKFKNDVINNIEYLCSNILKELRKINDRK